MTIPSVIDVMTVIDAKSFVDGKDNAILMFANLAHAVGGNGTSQLRLRARPRDVIRISTISTSNQFDYVAIAYDIEHVSDDTVLDGSRKRVVSQLAVVKLTSRAEHEPPQVELRKKNFYFCETDVREPGTEVFDLKFVVYGPPSGGERPILGTFAARCSIMICVA